MLKKWLSRPNCDYCKRRARHLTVLFQFLDDEPVLEIPVCRKHGRKMDKERALLAQHDNEVLKGRK